MSQDDGDDDSIDVEALEQAILGVTLATGRNPEPEEIAAWLGIDEEWLRREYGEGYELEIEIDEELAAKLMAELGLDKINAPGGKA